jgi:hypothetical protein
MSLKYSQWLCNLDRVALSGGLSGSLRAEYSTKTRTGKWSQAWIIGGYPNFVERERLAQHLGAEIIFIEASQEECINRLLQDRDKQFVQQDWLNYIHDWFLKFTPTPPRSEFQGTELGTGEGTSDSCNPKI